MKKILYYIPIIVPVAFFIVVGISAYHFSNAFILLLLLISPRFDTRYVVSVSDGKILALKETTDANGTVNREITSN